MAFAVQLYRHVPLEPAPGAEHALVTRGVVLPHLAVLGILRSRAFPEIVWIIVERIMVNVLDEHPLGQVAVAQQEYDVAALEAHVLAEVAEPYPPAQAFLDGDMLVASFFIGVLGVPRLGLPRHALPREPRQPGRAGWVHPQYRPDVFQGNAFYGMQPHLSLPNSP